MRHARSDYDRIQDPAGLIPENEPVFLLRAQDVFAPQTLEEYADALRRNGAPPELVDAAREHAAEMRRWQQEHGSKVPDAPLGACYPRARPA